MYSYLSKFLYVLSDKHKQLLLLLLAFVLASLLEAFGIGLIGPFLSVVANPSIIQQHPALSHFFETVGFHTNSQIIIGLGIFVISVFCFKSLTYIFCKFYIYRFSYTQKVKLETRLVHTYLNIPYIFHLNHNSSDLINKIVIESHQFTTNCLIPLLEISSNLIVIACLSILLAYTDLTLLLVAMAVLLPTVLIFVQLSKRIRRWGRRQSESSESMIRAINHGLGGIKEAKVIGCEPFFERELYWQAQKNARASLLVDTFQNMPKVIIETVLVVFLLLFILANQLVSDRGLEDLTSVMGVFAVASIRLLPATSQMLNALGRIRASSYALSMLHHDLREIEKYGYKGSANLQNYQSFAQSFSKADTLFQDQVCLEQISYCYPNSVTPAVQSISLKFSKGESIGLIGKSGSGKTTLVDIVLGLLQPSSGDIKVDGQSIYTDLRSWQQLLGYIPQSIFLLDDTIEQNIAFGVERDAIDPLRLQAAIEAAQLTELIEYLPDGLLTQVGERGVRLSGGQRQRIGIARAIYHGREILVLDEATSALDTETEQLVSESINALAGSKTLIIIAHRMSTVQNCDRIYRLDQGHLIQSGTYDEVILKPVN